MNMLPASDLIDKKLDGLFRYGRLENLIEKIIHLGITTANKMEADH